MSQSDIWSYLGQIGKIAWPVRPQGPMTMKTYLYTPHMPFKCWCQNGTRIQLDIRVSRNLAYCLAETTCIAVAIESIELKVHAVHHYSLLSTLYIVCSSFGSFYITVCAIERHFDNPVIILDCSGCQPPCQILAASLNSRGVTFWRLMIIRSPPLSNGIKHCPIMLLDSWNLRKGNSIISKISVYLAQIHSRLESWLKTPYFHFFGSLPSSSWTLAWFWRSSSLYFRARWTLQLEEREVLA